MNVQFGQCSLELLPEGALWIAAKKLLCVADLHFEKDSFFHRFGTFLPPYGSEKNLAKLQSLLQKYEPDIFVAAGDSFHDKHAVQRMSSESVDHLNSLIMRTKNWHWIVGNHDPEIGDRIRGERSAEFRHDELIIRHKALLVDDWEISGHYHPKIRFAVRGHFFNTPCFVLQHKKLFMPAFGQYTGGLDINNEAFPAAAQKSSRQVYAIYEDRIFSL